MNRTTLSGRDWKAHSELGAGLISSRKNSAGRAGAIDTSSKEPA